MDNPKRILIIGLTERMGGVETFIYNTTLFSDKTKYKYDYLVHGTDHCVFEKEINEFYNDGEKHIYFTRKYKENPLGCILDLNSFYRENAKKYDYIHFQSGSTAEILYVWPFCQKYRIPVISHSHNGHGYNPLINALFRPIVNIVSSKRLACSIAAAEWLFGKKNIVNTQIIVNGIDVERFTFDSKAREKVRQSYNIKEEQFVVGHIGRFSEQKNHIFILDVFCEIHKKAENSILMLVGVGELEKSIKSKAQELGLRNAIIFAGKQSRTEDYYSAFDVFLMPSLYEGLPIVGVEAQCEGLECFFSDQIDSQILITSRAYMLSLKESACMWAKEILTKANSKIERKKLDPKICSEYSICNTISELQKVYGIEEHVV